MDCTRVESLLVAYHLATLEEGERDAIDRHLLECKGCLGTYSALKRAFETRPLDRPSPIIKQRLRAEVLRMGAGRRRIGILGRRIPLYQGVVAAAVAAALALVAPRVIRRADHGRADDVTQGAPRVDSARPRAESFQIY